MTRIKQIITDSGGNPITAKMRVQLADVLIYGTTTPDTARLPRPAVFNVPEGQLDIELQESATQRVSYDFTLFTESETRTFYLENRVYNGPSHKENDEWYTGAVSHSERKQLGVVTNTAETVIYDLTAIVPDKEEIDFNELLGQSVVAARFVDRGFYRSVMLGLPSGRDDTVTVQNIATLQAQIQALEARIDELERSGD